MSGENDSLKISNIYRRVENAICEKIGSRAKTNKGRARAMLKQGKRQLALLISKVIAPECLTGPEWKVSVILRRGKVGESLVISCAYPRLPGFVLSPLPNEKLRIAALAAGHRLYPRKKHIYSGRPCISGSYRPGFIERREVIRYKGNYPNGSEIYCDYQSCVAMSIAGNLAVVVVGNKIARRIIAPAGLKFRNDSNGILLERQTDKMDYHPSVEDWHAKDFATRVRKGLATSFASRQAGIKVKRESDRLKNIFDQQIQSTWVTLDDSRRAGNCVEGTLRWAERKLNVSRDVLIGAGYLFSVPAAKLLAIDPAPSVKRAVQMAWSREVTISI